VIGPSTGKAASEGSASLGGLPDLDRDFHCLATIFGGDFRLAFLPYAVHEILVLLEMSELSVTTNDTKLREFPPSA
jgi:hypothetical protein